MRLDAIAMGQPVTRVPDLARDVQAAGFDGLWFTESGRTAYTGCTAAALTTDALDIGTAVALAFPRSPMVTAQIAWELADATQGRFVLGLGTQVKAHIERRYGMAFSHPGSRLREYVLALRAIFEAFQHGTPLQVDGEYWHLDLLPATWSPGPIEHPDVPIYLAAVRPWMARMAGEVADGIHVHPFHSARYLEEVVLPAAREGCAAAGRDPARFQVVCPVMANVGDTPEARGAAPPGRRGPRPATTTGSASPSTGRPAPTTASSTCTAGRGPRIACTSCSGPATSPAWPPRSPTRCSTPTPSPRPGTSSPTSSRPATAASPTGSSCTTRPRAGGRAAARSSGGRPSPTPCSAPPPEALQPVEHPVGDAAHLRAGPLGVIGAHDVERGLVRRAEPVAPARHR